MGGYLSAYADASECNSPLNASANVSIKTKDTEGYFMKTAKKKVLAFALLIGTMICLGACGKKDEVKDDLVTYVNDMTEAQKLQQEAIDTYNSYVNDPEMDSQELLTALTDTIIPKYSEYLDAINALAPATTEVTDVKLACVEGANKQYAALTKVKEAIEACDSDMLTEADSLIQESVQLFQDYETQLNTLAEEHEVMLINGTGSSAEE